MVKILAVASIVWPLVLAGSVWDRAATGGSVWTHLLYVSASRICHQRPERSFHTAGVKWPVCGRCSGLYLAGPAGALAALAGTRRRRRPGRPRTARPWMPHRDLYVLALAGLPTVITVAGEWFGVLPVTTLARAVSAMPLGAAIAYVIMRVAAGAPRPMEYTGAE